MNRATSVTTGGWNDENTMPNHVAGGGLFAAPSFTVNTSPAAGVMLYQVNPRERRYWRERAVAYAGPSARSLVESDYGDEAALALLRCSPGVARRLAAFGASGGLGKLPQPRESLMVIGHPNGGSDACLYVIKHANELTDPVCSEVFLEAPLDFVLGLKQLPAAVAERRDSMYCVTGSRLAANGRPIDQPRFQQACFGLGRRLLVLAVLLIRRKRRRASWTYRRSRWPASAARAASTFDLKNIRAAHGGKGAD